MFQDLFNHYLKRNQGFGRVNRRLSSLEKEVAELRRTSRPLEQTKEPPPARSYEPPNKLVFPSTLTININKNERTDPLKAYTRKMTKRGGSSQLKEESPVQGRSKDEDILDKLITQQINPSPTPPDKTLPSNPTYIEFLNVETIIIDRYEQSNNFGALGIKSLEGKLNIGANYGDKSDLPDEAKEKLKEKLNKAKEWKTYSENKELKPSMPESPSKIETPWEEIENLPDWDDFFSKQPCDADNNN